MSLRWVCCLLLAGLGWVSGNGGVFAATRVAVVVDSPEQAEEWQALITAELSKNPSIQLVERQNFAALVQERANASGLGPKARPLAAGWENVEIYLHCRKPENQAGKWWLEVVDATTGARLNAAQARAQAFPEVADLTAAAGQLLASQRAPSASAKPLETVAVSEFPAANASPAALLTFAARLRDALGSNGFSVLDRTLTQELVIERNEADRGLRKSLPDLPFSGARSVIEVHANADGKSCELRLVSTANNRLKASRSFPFEEPGGVTEILQWLIPQLCESPQPILPYQSSVEIEALEPFYRGLALYEAGKYPEAASEFTQAYLLNGKFRDAYLWEARCYDALGMEPLARMVRRFADTELVGRFVSSSVHAAPTEVITFLGVTEPDGKFDAVLSGLAASLLCSQKKAPIQLPQTLQTLRREYDWLAGLPWTTGNRWENAAGFRGRFALRGERMPKDGHFFIRWTVRDTVSGQSVFRDSELPADNASRWPEKIRRTLEDLLAQAGSLSAETNASNRYTETGDPSELEKTLRSTKGMDANVAFLKLALVDPQNPLLCGKKLLKEDSPRDGLEAYIEYGFREWLISRLPDGNPRRRWLELFQIQSFLPLEPIGRLFSGRNPDGEAELEKFIAANPMDDPGLMARYLLLYLRQRKMPPAELAERGEALFNDLSGVSSGMRLTASVKDALRSLIDIAQIAAGNSEKKLPKAHFPAQLKLRFGDDGVPQTEIDGQWFTNEARFFTLTPEEEVREAQAMIQLNGRPGAYWEVQDRWMKDYPNSMVMASFLAAVLHEANFWYGVPLTHPLNWAAQKETIRNVIFYAAETYKFWSRRADSAESLNQLENRNFYFLAGLHERAYLGIITDEEFLAIRDDLAAAFREADKRLGRPGWTWRNPQILAWQELTLPQARELTRDHLLTAPPLIWDREALLGEIRDAARISFRGSPVNPQAWWRKLREGAVRDSFTLDELANFHLEHLPEIESLYSLPDLTGPEMNELFEQAMVLFEGGRNREAEALFRRIIDTPASDLNRSEESEKARINARFRLAQLLRLNGRIPEAIEQAQTGLEEISSGHVSQRNPKRLKNRLLRRGLSAQLVRLLGEMRFDPARAVLPDRVGVVSVKTPNADNPDLRIYYREPAFMNASRPAQVLLITTPYNDSVLNYLESNNPWTRFADAHGVVLVAPELYGSTASERASSQFCDFIYAQIWSGKALKEGLQQIGKRLPIRETGLWIHAYGAGSAFAGRLVRWDPKLASRVALHAPGWGAAYFQEYPGLKPFEELRDVDFLVTAGEQDDFATSTRNRRAIAETLVTFLRGAGVSAEWKQYPNVNHWLAPEMEEDSRHFFVNP